VSPDPVPDDHVRARLDALSAIDAALADPVRVVRTIAAAEDEDDAARRIAADLGLDEATARTVLDQQYRSLTRSNRARLAEELRVLRAPWGEPLPATLVVRDRRLAVLTLDGADRTFRARGENALLDQVARHLLEEVARPRLRPITVTTSGLSRGPTVVTVLPSGSVDLDAARPGPG
jgi:hypothetical protein